MKNNNKISLGIFLTMLLISSIAMATGPRVTQSMLVVAENEMFAVDAPPFISLAETEGGLNAEIVKSALAAVEIKSTLTVLPVVKMVNYYLYEEQALAVYDRHMSFSGDEKSLIYVPVFHMRENYFYSKFHHKSDLNWKGKLDDLSGLTYGAHRGENISVYEKAGIKVVFARHNILVKKLAAGEVDFIQMPTLTRDWMLEHDASIQQYHFAAMKAETELAPQFIVFNKNNPEGKKIAEKLKQGLQVILSNGKYENILKRYLHEGVDVEARVEALSQLIKQ